MVDVGWGVEMCPDAVSTELGDDAASVCRGDGTGETAITHHHALLVTRITSSTPVTRGGTIHRCIDISRYFSRDTYRDIIF